MVAVFRTPVAVAAKRSVTPTTGFTKRLVDCSDLDKTRRSGNIPGNPFSDSFSEPKATAPSFGESKQTAPTLNEPKQAMQRPAIPKAADLVKATPPSGQS